jgi:hypothetical protein
MYKKFTLSGALSKSNPSCDNTETICIKIFFSSFNKFTVNFSMKVVDVNSNNSIITRPIDYTSEQSEGHEYGGYQLDIKISNIQYSLTDDINSYGAALILLSSLLIQFGDLYTFKVSSDANDLYNIINYNSNSANYINFSFVIPPKIATASLNASPVNTFKIKISINDGYDFLSAVLTHTYVAANPNNMSIF